MWPSIIESVSDASFVSFCERIVYHLNSYQLEDKPLCLSYNQYFLFRTIMLEAYFNPVYANMINMGLSPLP